MTDLGYVTDKAAIRDILTRLDERRGFSPGALGVEQATNAIGRLQRAPRDIEEIARTAGCDYCGRTAGNPCQRNQEDVSAHPSRMRKALAQATIHTIGDSDG